MSPAGYLGRGTHYSVLRAVVFHDLYGKPLSEGQFVDFAVIWDEDHDTRVMEPIEEIYRRGLLSSFMMFGERKGLFTAVLSSRFSSPNDISFDLAFNPAFLIRVDELNLSVRSAICLKNDNIVYIGDLVQKTDGEMLRTNFGLKSLNEIKAVLAQLGLHLGMEVPSWPPENIEYLVKGEGLVKRERVALLKTEINTICQSLDDSWPSEVVAIGNTRNPIINDEDEKVSLYLKNLEMLWQLGTAVRRPQQPAKLITADNNRIVPLKRPAVDAGIAPGWTTDPLEADRDAF